jgi:hypothetical protein
MQTFIINGYWKDDQTEFNDYLVTDSQDEMDDDNIFYYGLTEDEIKSILNVENNNLEFVITSYNKI